MRSLEISLIWIGRKKVSSLPQRRAQTVFVCKLQYGTEPSLFLPLAWQGSLWLFSDLFIERGF